MIRAEEGRFLTAADTSVLLNFMKVERLDLVSRHRDYRIVVTEHVREEVIESDQAALLGYSIALGEIVEVEVTDPSELTLSQI